METTTLCEYHCEECGIPVKRIYNPQDYKKASDWASSAKIFFQVYPFCDEHLAELCEDWQRAGEIWRKKMPAG